MKTETPDLRRILRQQFGHAQFRPGQEATIRALLRGKDVLTVLPTGAGKSLVFQLTSQLLPSLTLVVSPHIALMKDQDESVREAGLEAGVVNSALGAAEIRESLDRAEQGEARLLYVTPERLQNAEFLATARSAGVSLLAIDEAHCVSEWGHDFRPAYLGLADAADQLGRPPILALTATATPWVRREIVDRLRLRDPQVIVHGVDRPNLFFEARHVEQEQDEYRVLRSLLLEEEADYPPPVAAQLSRMMDGCGIIYVRTTAAAEETACWLREWGIEADYYHGQRRKSDRERVQDGFMSGAIRVIAATNAFGLGVDKPDVRFVIHRHVPASVEAYYQEAGRAGRDGEPARCTLLFRPAALSRAGFLAATGQVSRAELRAVCRFLSEHETSSPEEVRRATRLGKSKLARSLGLLEAAGLIGTAPEAIRRTAPLLDARSVSLESEEARHAYERSRLEMMRSYAEIWTCRRSFLLSYFGEELGSESCGFCDNDLLRGDAENDASEAETLAPQARVRHRQWGAGTILEAQSGTITVRFDTGQERKLDIELTLAAGLLEIIRPAEPSAPSNGYRTGDRVSHPEYGPGDVQRVTEEAVTILFERAGYHTLSRERAELMLEAELAT